MEDTHSLKIEDKWLLSIMGMFSYVKGKTRLQKLGMISFYEALKDEEFFDDWTPGKYGGFSRRQAAALESLEESGHVMSNKISTIHDTTYRYSLTKKGERAISDFCVANSTKLEEMRRILSYYNSCPLKKLLGDTYQKYPHLTTRSTIIADINRATDLDSHSVHEPMDQFHTKPSEMTPASPPASQHVLGDMDFREELAKSIGLEEIPDLDSRSFDRIRGLWSKRMGVEPFDASDAVKEVRNW